MTVLALLACLAWATMVLAWGRYWQAGPSLAPVRAAPPAPALDVVVPARDEADGIEVALRSLLAQDYAGPLRVILVDDQSTDGTGAIARAIAAADPRLVVIEGGKRPAGWSGKLWAVAQGVERAEAPLVLLTDADIVHDPLHLATLAAKLEADGLDLVSEMVELRCTALAERLLVPAFVYFFAMLYPFAWVNDPQRGTAAAAGGTVLLRRRALERIGGVRAVRGALIDDVALARAVKRGGRIWLGHSQLARSVRPYPDALSVWRMVARTAYVQLGRSPAMLLLCIAGMGLVWLVPPGAALLAHGAARWLGLAAWVAMALSYVPTLRRFRLSPLWAPLLPGVAVFYMAATLGSALDHHRGRGVVWKRRAYA
jgi:hopene-associated glycosyltransferase HpnB